MSYLAHWTLAWPVLAIWVVLAGLHVAGLVRSGRSSRGAERAPGAIRPDLGHDHGPAPVRSAGRVCAFQGGLLVVLLGIVSPVAYWAGIYIWVRSVQDLLVAVVAPALIVVGRPGPALVAGVRRTGRGGPGSGVLARAGGSVGPGASGKTARNPWWLRYPVGVTVAFNVVWLGWHVPGLYDSGHTNAGARYLEFGLYLVAGIGFWVQLFGSASAGPVAPAIRRLGLLVGTVVADTILGMVLVFGSGVLYPAYRGAAHHALSVVADQQVGGGVLWMGMLPPLIIASVALLMRWLDHDETYELTRELDRLTRQPAAGRPAWASSGRGAWVARPGTRRPTT
jgi:cytochrome c oxidase assembly factor CtaG